MQGPREKFHCLPLRVHSFLIGMPLRTLYRLELPGGRAGMTLPEIKDVLGFSGAEDYEVGSVTRALFWLRGWIGRLLQWDDAPELAEARTYLTRLSEEDRVRSLVLPGTREGISRVLYCFEHEFLAEIINRTVHCFWLIAAERTANGYALYFGESLAYDINNSGQVVGHAYTIDNRQHAFLINGGAMQDLNDLIPANTGWELSIATKLSHDGRKMVGRGIINGQHHAFLLTLSPSLMIGTLMDLVYSFNLQSLETGLIKKLQHALDDIATGGRATILSPSFTK